MSLSAVLEIVEHAIDDAAYRTLLLEQPASALHGADLTSEERRMLRGLAESPYTASERGLADVRKMVLGALEFGGE